MFSRVAELLKKAVEEKGQRTVARESDVALMSVQRYLKGETEPTTASLQKLATYFEVSVAWLRGEESISSDKQDDGVEINRASEALSSEMFAMLVDEINEMFKGKGDTRYDRFVDSVNNARKLF